MAGNAEELETRREAKDSGNLHCHDFQVIVLIWRFEVKFFHT